MGKQKMQQRLMRKTAVFSLLFFMVSMGMILHMSANKVITIENLAQDEVAENAAVKEAAAGGDAQKSLLFKAGEADSSYLRIPLPSGSKADDIIIENHYMDRELWILVPKAEEDFYAENLISGNREDIDGGTYEVMEEGVALNFRLTGIFECRTILENENLYISFLSPREVNDKIVVIDAGYGGSDAGAAAGELKEKEITLQVARRLKAKLDESGVKVYYTRMDDIGYTDEERIALGNETRADMFIRIETGFSEDTSVYGTEAVYNGDYFIPGFGSIELADCLEREVATAVQGKALGLVEAGQEDTVLKMATVPAAIIRVGYLSNAQEAILLGREEYVEKIAAGIYNAIMKAYEEYQ